jgi:hypothetical protein
MNGEQRERVSVEGQVCRGHVHPVHYAEVLVMLLCAHAFRGVEKHLQTLHAARAAGSMQDCVAMAVSMGQDAGIRVDDVRGSIWLIVRHCVEEGRPIGCVEGAQQRRFEIS